jgi:serine/threonine protein kinase
MQEKDGKKEIPKINLMNREPDQAPTVEEDNVEAPESPPPAAMSMERLKENYRHLLRYRAIYYPVAYQFLRELGKGRQGTVFLCLRQGARGCITKHALKLFDPGIYRSAEEYWTDMGRIASQISHLHGLQSPHLVTRHSYDEIYGIGYVQMESIDGIDMRRFLSGNHLDIARQNSTPAEWGRFAETIFWFEEDKMALRPGIVVYVLRSLLRGLERLHSSNFLHSDVKPGNIMVDRLGSVRIVDFGRAVRVKERLSFLLGSPMYMAPETHRRELADIRSDLYSVGLIGLEMLSGQTIADTGELDEEHLLEIKHKLPERLDEMLPPKVRKQRNLVHTIARLIDPDPENRYKDAKEAEVGEDGLFGVDKQLIRAGVEDEYSRELSDYLAKLVDKKTERIEISDFEQGNTSDITKVVVE